MCSVRMPPKNAQCIMHTGVSYSVNDITYRRRGPVYQFKISVYLQIRGSSITVFLSLFSYLLKHTSAITFSFLEIFLNFR